MTAREKLLAHLAAAGATLTTTLAAHNVPLDVFDEFPGEARDYESASGNWRSKRGRVGGLEWVIYSVNLPEPEDAHPGSGT